MNRLVIGCGYLGARAARHWRECGDNVWATTRQDHRAEEFRQFGWQPIVVDITKQDSVQAAFSGLPQLDSVLVAVGYDRNSHLDRRQVYVKGLSHVLDYLPNSARHLIYISSTGVYGDAQGNWVDESSSPNPVREGGKAIWETECVLEDSPWKRKSTVLRLAGLYGPGRIPNLERVRQRLAGKDAPAIALEGYLNLVHVDDAAQVVAVVAERDPTGELFLVSDGTPVLRRDYYSYLVTQLERRGGRDPDGKAEETCHGDAPLAPVGKRVSNRKLVTALGFKFEYPDFRAGLDQILGAQCGED